MRAGETSLVDRAGGARTSRLSLLVELSSLLTREVELDLLLRDAAAAIARALHAERATVWLVDAERGDLVTQVAVLPELAELRQPMDQGIVGFVASTGESVRTNEAASEPRFDATADARTGFTTRSVLAVPVREAADLPVRGVIQALNRSGGAFDGDDERYLRALGIQLGRALAMTTLRAEHALGPGLTWRGPFNHIVGRGPAMERVYQRLSLCAPTDATVLLRGETGTGKTRLARAIHVNSPRRDGPFVTLDCTTLPSQLVESELFGHERGAFTGAEREVRGKVEMADGGTLFLDEIGDLPPGAQGKLLRFVQERVFERVGGRETRAVDVRLVCATHRDLEAAVAEGRFRPDLYYRLCVVPIDVPCLAERGPDEIERLARHFAGMYAERHGRSRPRFVEAALASLRRHAWPGNVRELEHWIEGALVLAPDGVIRPDPRHTEDAAGRSGNGVTIPLGLTVSDARDAYIRDTVRACSGNKSEAARRLGVSRNTVARACARESGR